MATKKKAIKKGEVIDLRSKVTVVSTKDDKFHKTGDEFRVHPKVAGKLIANGKATLKKGESLETKDADETEKEDV